MRSYPRALGACVLAVTLAQTDLAFGGDATTAETLFRRGLDSMQQGRFKEACEAFAGSNEADPSPGTEINLALCNEKQGKLASAWGWYKTAAGLALQRGQAEREKLARDEAAKIEPKLHKLVVNVKFPANGLAVTRNGQPVPAATFGSDVPIDPGEHVIEVTAQGKKTWKQTLRIEPGPGIDRVDVPALEDVPVERKSIVSPGDLPSDGSTQRTFGFVVGGVGIAAGVTAILFEIVALKEQSKSKSLSSDASSATDDKNRQALQESASSHHKAAETNELVAIGMGIGGVALIGVGTALLLTAPRSQAPSRGSSKPVVVPLFGRDNVGLGLVGSF